MVPFEANNDYKVTSRENSAEIDQDEVVHEIEAPLEESNQFIDDVSHKKELKKKFNY